ncbi:MAG TPA: putative baseplate assembly protein [Burkholderiaceae bacterium]|nr:putative baseplate assembly protein [Burkholderiaceae bacterium]
MPLTPPRLDDLDFATLVQGLRSRIPVVAPDWTDHNDSDPGIAMIQLFAHLAEMVGYRLNRVPEKAYVEFLKLVGVRLAPARPASTRIAFTLIRPERATAVLLPAGSRIAAKAGKPPPQFETDRGFDLLPAQLAALVTTRHELLDINGPGETGPAAGTPAKAYIAERFSIAWDGKSPRLKDMPTQPLRLFAKPSEELHRNLYVALAFNQSVAAGFKGARAALHLQLDDDETPDAQVSARAGTAALAIVNAMPGGLPPAQYHYFRPPGLGESAGRWEPLHVLSDETDGWTRSGQVHFEVPLKIGPVPTGSWQDVASGLPHPLRGALKTPVDDTPAEVPVSGWLRVRFASTPRCALRSLSFNTVVSSQLETVRGERLGAGNGRSDQTAALGSGNVAPGTLALVSRETGLAGDTVVAWREVTDFDTATADDAVYALDPEAGTVVFGDGVRGRPPREGERLLASVYRHGGGLAGNVATGAVSLPSGLPAPVSGAFNIMPARGGRDAETLDQAKVRAPQAFSMRGRAVTAQDFARAACAAPGVRIARATVVPLRRPYPQGHFIGGFDAAGVDIDTEAPGALTVVVVPDVEGDFPMPTGGELQAVTDHLDGLRLVTTEVHVAPPMYLRLFDLELAVRAAAGHSAAALRIAIGDELRRRFHALSGGADGQGYAFGGSLHHADLVAAVLSVPGVARVEALSCWVDGQAPADSEIAHHWRPERQRPQRLTNCPIDGVEDDILQLGLFGDELPFIDASSLLIQVVGS